MTWPPGIQTAWFGAPVTAIGVPLTARLVRVELPLPAAPNTCEASAITKSAEMPTPPTVMLKVPREDWEATSFGQLHVEALRHFATSHARTPPAFVAASRAF